MGQKLTKAQINFNDDILEANDILETIDTIAADYILSMDKKAIEQLLDLKFCNKLRETLLLVFDTHIKGIDVFNLNERILKGDYYETSNLDLLPLKSSCEQVAEFYASIANLYSIIISIIKPKRKSNSGQKQLEICSNAKSAFTYLDQLYYDKYNFKTNKFDSFTQTGGKAYNEDLDNFYQSVFDQERPHTIKSFSDIDFSQLQLHSTEKEQINSESANQSLVSYGSHVKQLLKKTTQTQKDLVNILDQLFLPVNDAEKQKFRVHPSLTILSLKRLLNKTRKIIAQLYIACERDQVMSKYLFDSAVKEISQQSLHRQIAGLKEAQLELLN